MNVQEKEEQRELKKELISERAKVERRDKKIEDQDRLIDRLQATINDMVEDKRKDQNKIEVLMKQKYDIDKEMLT